MTVTEWSPSPAGVELGPDDACHTTCVRFDRRPDRADPGLGWCSHCGACVGKPDNRKRAAVDEEPFGYPKDGKPVLVGRGLVDEFGVTIPTTEGAA